MKIIKNYDTKLAIKLVSFLCVTSIFTYIGLYLNSLNNIDYYYSIESIKSWFQNNKNNQSCYPFNQNYKPFRIKIDNIAYPRIVPLHLNE